jgi:hypothetical protein
MKRIASTIGSITGDTLDLYVDHNRLGRGSGLADLDRNHQRRLLFWP